MEYGDVYVLPYEGGLLEQPFKTATLWRIFKSEVVDHIAKENKKRMNKRR